ncbi:MAG TPA: EamA family transporter [Candidatus Krumholzibacteria bacterium]|nr:EamA family transporter [Candidatus Krumholzibacteria bacterium]
MNVRGLVHLLIVYIVWGSTYLGIRIAVRDGSGFPAFAMAGTRVFVASLILLAWGKLAKKSLRPTRQDVEMFAASGLLLWLGGNGLVSWAEKRAESAHAALLVSSLPLWTTTLESFLDRRPPTIRLIGALAIGMAGVAVLNYPMLQHGSRSDITAVLALLIAVFSWGIGSVMQKRRPITLSGEVSSGYQLLFGSAFLIAASILSGEPRPHPTPDAWLAWGYLVVFGSVIAFTSFVKALQLLPVHVVATYAYVNPVIAVLLGWLILAERITQWTVAGSILVLLGVAGVFHEQRRRAAKH